ncbi:hypothetical protein F5X98DRAFT_340989 [Xylaria grammica]|nr:hypothetical protein F5X98DRAFT_340989 [Xylaria grammica]
MNGVTAVVVLVLRTRLFGTHLVFLACPVKACVAVLEVHLTAPSTAQSLIGCVDRHPIYRNRISAGKSGHTNPV